MQWVTLDQVGDWYLRSRRLSEFTHSVGRSPVDQDYLAGMLGFPLHLEHVVRRLAAERGEVAADALDSIPFYSLCRGLWLPLSGMLPERAAQLFGLVIDEPPDSAARGELLRTFMSADIGLPVVEKVACLLGDPFRGARSTFRRDSLLRFS